MLVVVVLVGFVKKAVMFPAFKVTTGQRSLIVVKAVVTAEKSCWTVTLTAIT